MTTVIKHALRAGASYKGGYQPQGWRPRLKVDLRGPTAAGAELVWTVTRPDGSAWFEHRVDAPHLADGETETVELQSWEDDQDIDEPGTAAFTLCLVSELDGVDEALHDGALVVTRLEGEHVYAVDNDWFLALAFVCLDAVDESDGPRLVVTTFLKGAVDGYQVEAHLFYEGTRGAQASDVSTGYTFASNDGTQIGQEIVATFDDVRGWNNLADQGWGQDSWHVLAAHDGAYEVRVLRENKIARVVPIEVAGGRIVAPGAIEGDCWTGPKILTDATISGDADGECAGTADAFYGDAATAAAWITIDDVYAARKEPAVAQEAAGPELDEAGQEKAQAVRDAGAQLIMQFAPEFEGASPPWNSYAIQNADTIQYLQGTYLDAKKEAADVPADFMTQYDDVPISFGDLVARVDDIIAIGAKINAEATGAAAAGTDAEVGPFRALLANDKLAVFEDHSPPSQYLYYTSSKKVIETPEELAAADEWYFEGTTEIQGKATVDGTSVDVSVQGWRVLGWTFDKDGHTVSEWEKTGEGQDAPKSAFRPEAS